MFRKLAADESGGIAVMAAFSLTVAIGAGGLAVEAGQAYTDNMRNRRGADAAALGAAMVLKNQGRAAVDASLIESTAKAIAIANGMPGSLVEAHYLENINGITDQNGVEVRVTSRVPIRLGGVLTDKLGFDVTSMAIAALAQPRSSPCVIALGTGNSFTASGGAKFTANGCAINANGNMTTSGGAQISASSIDLGGSVITSFASSITTDPYPNRIYDDMPNAASDPLADDPRVISALAQVGSYRTPVSPSDPDTPGGVNLVFDWTWPAHPSTAAYKIFDATNDKYVLPAGNYNLGSISISGGIKVRFQGPSTITIRNGILHSGNSLVFDGGTGSSVKINGGIRGLYSSDTSPINFGDGDYEIGAGSVKFTGSLPTTFGNGNVTFNTTLETGGGTPVDFGDGRHIFRRIVVGSGARIRIGNGNFDVTEDISMPAGGQMMIGAGDYTIGRNPSTGDAIYQQGGSALMMANARFSAGGHIKQVDGGSRLVIGPTENHLIRGHLSMLGSVLFGDGRYTFDGDFTNGAGGTNWPFTSAWGITYGDVAPYKGYAMAGKNVTFVTHGTIRLGGGALTHLLASTVPGPADGEIQDMVFLSDTSQPSAFVEGAGSKLSGTFWMPNSAFLLSGGATMTSGSSCFTMIVKTLTVNGGTAGGLTCPSLIPLLGAFDVALIK